MNNPLLKIENLEVSFQNDDGSLQPAVRGIDLELDAGETLAIVGESGSGKSVTSLAMTRLLPDPPRCRVSGSLSLNGQDISSLSSRQLQKVRGGTVAYIFQEPSTSLNPVYTIGFQIREALQLHRPDLQDHAKEAHRLLVAVGIQDPAQTLRDYPHQLSGGMQQRAMIAMALACQPRLLVADEPTTALDVTIQAQIIDLLKNLKEETGMAILLITHNFGIVSGFADRVMVMFRGEVVESGPTRDVLKNPQHPYTQALIDCIPRLGHKKERLTTIDHEKLA